MTTQFKEGDKVEFIEHYMDEAIAGAKGTVTHVTTRGTFTTVRLDNGGTFTPYSYRLKLVEEPATIKVGDTVKVISKSMANHGKTGTVTSVDSGYSAWPIMVRIDGGGEPCYAASELEVVTPKGFTFKDIQEGDTIRRTRTYTSGATEVREGTVSRIDTDYVTENSESFILAYGTDDRNESINLELLNRPETAKEPWETAKKGDRLVVKNGTGITRVLTKLKGDEWDCLLIGDKGNVSVGVPRNTDTVTGQIKTNTAFSNSEPNFIPA